MIGADLFALAIVAGLLLLLVGIAALPFAILAAIRGATPGGFVPRTMDPAASWRAAA